MVEQVSNRRLYDVTLTKPYKQALTANQVIQVGDTFNPFFRFYETARRYNAPTLLGLRDAHRTNLALHRKRHGF